MKNINYCIICALALGLLACTPQPQMRMASGAVWGTTYHIKYICDRDLSDSIVAVMHAIDMSLSPFEPQSLVSAINAGHHIKADSMLIDVFRISQDVCALSDGMFDPTVAPLVNLWGFGYRQGVDDRPSQAQIDSALMAVGIRDCFIDDDGYMIRKRPTTEFNYSAIAKGYGVDRIAHMLQRNGCNDYMVEVGGEVALKGNGPSGDKWRIQIDAPIPESGGTQHTGLQTLHISDACIATSGNYRNHRATSEGVVGHTISPITGMPVVSNTLSATVIAQSTALADALATAIMAMPPDQAIAMIENIDDVESLIVFVGQPFTIYRTKGFDRLMQAHDQ